MVGLLTLLGFRPAERTRDDEKVRNGETFSGVPDSAFGAVPMSRLEQDACYLMGTAPEPERLESDRSFEDDNIS